MEQIVLKFVSSAFFRLDFTMRKNLRQLEKWRLANCLPAKRKAVDQRVNLDQIKSNSYSQL